MWDQPNKSPSHPLDRVLTEDNGWQDRQDCHEIEGKFYFSHNSYLEARHEQFATFFRQEEEWIEEYTQSEDFTGEYAYLINEGDRAINSIRDRLDRPELAELVWDIVYRDGLYDIQTVAEYSPIGDDYLDGFPIGEYESQLEYGHIEERLGPIDWDELCDWADNQSEFQLSLNRTPHTINNHTYYSGYHHTYISSRCDYVLSDDNLQQATTEAIINTCRIEDNKLARLLPPLFPWDFSKENLLIMGDYWEERGDNRAKQCRDLAQKA
jgi:hypothetical protein